jgi:hypothetical protein
VIKKIGKIDQLQKGGYNTSTRGGGGGVRGHAVRGSAPHKQPGLSYTKTVRVVTYACKAKMARRLVRGSILCRRA